MRVELVQYLECILPPFFLIWLFVFALPEDAFPLRLAAQIFSFIFVRDAMLPTRMWSISPDFTLAFINDALSLYVVSLSSLFMAFLIYYANQKRAKVVLMRGKTTTCLYVGIVASVIIYIPVYFLKNSMGANTSTIHDVNILFGNLALTLCGNLVEEMLFRSHLACYLHDLNVAPFRSAFIQAFAFTIFHTYLAYVVTNCGVLLLVFTFWEGIVCALIQQKYGLMSATLAHALAIFYISINLCRY